MAAIVLLGALAAATLVRLAPGFDVSEQQLDPRLSHDSVEALRAQRGDNANLGRFYRQYLSRALHGDFGFSLTLNRPVRDLLVERFPATARLVGLGLLAGWLLAAALALSGAWFRQPAYDVATAIVGSTVLCLPSAVLALLLVLWKAPACIAIALVVFPRIFRYARDLLARNYQAPHILTAHAKGLGPARVLFCHVLPVSAAPLIAAAAVSVSMALGAAIPVEALCGIPGIGQLAWQAALGRDLAPLVTVTVIVTLVTLAANSVSDLLNSRLPEAKA
jgi:peptide/nickel transport system permease protein